MGFPWHKSIDTDILERWRIICNDDKYWKCGIYSPEFSSPSEVRVLEKHSCPELFLLLEGSISVIVRDEDGERILPLEKNMPMMIRGWHNAFCPEGANTGKALVIERDELSTEFTDRM